MKISTALNIRPHEIISLVGGGGKTTLMFALARELAATGCPVVTTTTTKILEPSPEDTDVLIIEKDEGRLAESLTKNIRPYRHITVAGEKPAEGKLQGISLETVARIASQKEPPYILIEADGARRKSLKAPEGNEPVIPPVTSLVVPVVGIDAVGQPLTEEYVFRAETAGRLLGIPLGTIITTEIVARLITHPQGIARGSPAGARIVPFINKMGRDKGLLLGKDLARQILASHHPQIERVVLGCAASADPVVAVIE